MSIYELEERIFFDGALPVDVSETVGSDQDIVSSEQSVDDDLSVDAGQDAIDGDSPADDQDSSESENSQLDDHEPYESYTSYEGDAAIPDSLLDSLSLPDDYELNPNVIIISTEHENFEEISNSINDNTILIEYSTDDSIETILENLKAELGGIKAVNIGILQGADSITLDITEAGGLGTDTPYLNTDELIDALDDYQTVDGGTVFVNELSNLSTSSGLSFSEFFDLDSDFAETISSSLQPVDPSTQNEIVFINSSVMNSEEIVDDLSPNAEVVYLEKGSDGIEQITEYLQDKTDIDTIRIISHGNEEYFVLNGQIIDSDYLTENGEVIASWSNSLSENADIMLYGCNLAATDDGKTFVDSFADLTGADVAAATFNTGGTEDNGWNLEFSVGTVESSQLIINGYEYHLADQIVENANNSGVGSLRQAIADVESGDSITFDGDYSITLSLELSINKSMTISGGDNDIIINGNSSCQVFYINDPAGSIDVSLENLTIQNGYAEDGIGGGIWNAETLTIRNCTINTNSATGSGDFAGSGGGVANSGGTITFEGTNTFTGNNVSQNGGGIYNESGSIILNGTNTFSGNTAGNSWDKGGDAIYIKSGDPGGTLSLGENSVLYMNESLPLYYENGDFTANNSTVVFNRGTLKFLNVILHLITWNLLQILFCQISAMLVQ